MRGEPRSGAGGPQEATERHWWQRMLEAGDEPR
jgi:hypothetical protein